MNKNKPSSKWGVRHQVTGEQTAKWRKEVGGQGVISAGVTS